MIKKVLIVDDDQEMLLSLKGALGKYGDTFSVSMAGDGAIALEKLRKENISLVVTDLKMSGMDGFALLARIMEKYPEIPVIIMTGYSTPKMKKMALQGGAVGYIEKPFMVDDLGRQTVTILRKESDGGTLHSISSATFLQLIEMEEQTCTIRLEDRSSGRQGVLFFRKGELIDARTHELTGEAAAYAIFSWDKVNLSIQNDCFREKRTIRVKLQAVYLEAMRLKDETGEPELLDQGGEITGEAEKKNKDGKPDEGDMASGLRNQLESEIGAGCGVEDIYQDDSWLEMISKFDRIGSFFNAGKFKVGLVDRGEKNEYILLPGKKTTVVAINPKCPREKILQVLGR